MAPGSVEDGFLIVSNFGLKVENVQWRRVLEDTFALSLSLPCEFQTDTSIYERYLVT